MNVLIVEDEPLAAAQLSALVTKLRPQANIVGVCDTIKSTVDWLNNNATPDLAFFDIQLGDGLSFEIFRQVNVNLPIIFTTAYNQYAIKAFKVNSIDYLLKPIQIKDLAFALDQFDRQQSSSTIIDVKLIEEVNALLNKPDYKERFLVKIGSTLRIVETVDILYFYSFEKGTYIKTNDKKDYLIDYSLEAVETLINPEQFFRINRKHIVALKSIQKIYQHSNSRLKLELATPSKEEFLVAREKVKLFKEWVNK